MKNCRGGAINYQKGSTDIEHLTDLVSSHCKDHGPVNFFDFGEYNSLSSSHAVRGTALARNGQFIMCLLKARADACITYTDLKSSFANVVLKFPEVMTHKHKDVKGFAGEIADRCMVMLKHARSMALGENSDTIWKRCTANVPHYLMPVMTEIRETIKQSDKPFTPGANTKLKLAAHVSNTSDVSLDEMGLPTLSFAAEKPDHVPDEGDRLTRDAEELGIVPPTKKILKTQMGILKRPAAAKAKTKAHTKGKPTSHDLIQKVDQDSVKLHGPFALQSYITHMKPQKLVVACTAKQTPDHHKVLVKVLHYIKNSPNCSKQDAVEKRDKLLSNIS